MSSTRVRFVWWVLLGAGACLALLGALTIGVFLAPFVAIGAWLLLRRSGVDRSTLGLLTGASVTLFYVAWLNREGPGEVCHVRRTSTECADLWSPQPWLVAALVLFAAGVAGFLLLGRTTREPAGHP